MECSAGCPACSARGSRDAPTCSPGAMLTADPALVPPPRLQGWEGPHESSGVGGGLVYPKLGGKAAAWSGDEGEGLFQALDLCGIRDLHK